MFHLLLLLIMKKLYFIPFVMALLTVSCLNEQDVLNYSGQQNVLQSSVAAYMTGLR